MVQPIEVFLQPPSPTIKASFKLPSVKSLFPVSMEEDTNSQELPSIRLTNHSSPSDDTYYNDNIVISSPRLNTIEPRPDLSVATSPYQQSPIMTFSSPSSTTSSMVGSPLISPIQDGPFLLPPPDSSSFRRCRSVSNASNNSSPSASPSFQFTFRSLSEPPTLNLPPPTSLDNETTNTEDYHPIFGPKRKRGRPPNASRPELQTDSNWTFVKPTVWDVKQQQNITSTSNNSNVFTENNNTPQFYTENTVMSDGINTFTTTNMDMALSIPKKKRGRKPKKQLAGNSCFVWRDLTAPRGANKKSLLPKKKEKRSQQ
ncbi:hypothetical protein BDF21DRAFT_409357 [Thamnidium elegans]|nr:hypothetical protein BDF21DRAFT_409357 [Thamnidium elegans]